MSVAERYVRAAKAGSNPYTEFIRYLNEARRIIRRRHAGKFGRRTSRYIAKGGIRK